MFYAKLNQDRDVKMYQDNTGREKKEEDNTWHFRYLLLSF